MKRKCNKKFEYGFIINCKLSGEKHIFFDVIEKGKKSNKWREGRKNDSFFCLNIFTEFQLWRDKLKINWNSLILSLTGNKNLKNLEQILFETFKQNKQK